MRLQVGAGRVEVVPHRRIVFTYGWEDGDRVRSVDQHVGDPAAVTAFWG